MQSHIYEISGTELSSTKLISKIHGYMMSLLRSDYVDYLHSQVSNPYSLSIFTVNKQKHLKLGLLTQDAEENFLNLKLEGEHVLESLEDRLTLKHIKKEELSLKDLATLFAQPISYSMVTITFTSPTSFKSDNRYVIFPTSRLIIQNLMQKYEHLFGGQSSFDQEVINALAKSLQIIEYDLKTSPFYVHRNRIPAFIGKVKCRFYGPTSLFGYLQMLLTFADYCGIGIKTSIGMGGVKIEFHKD